MNIAHFKCLTQIQKWFKTFFATAMKCLNQEWKNFNTLNKKPYLNIFFLVKKD